MNSERSLKILIVDSIGTRARALDTALREAGYQDIEMINGGASLADDVVRLAPDVIIVDMALPERDTLEGLRQTTARTPCPIILCTEEEDSAFIEQAIAAGISSYHVGSVPTQSIKAIVTAAVALFRRYQEVEAQRKSALASLEERRIVQKAKAILMKRHGMTEPEAYGWLRKRAMKESRKLVSIAASLLSTERAE